MVPVGLRDCVRSQFGPVGTHIWSHSLWISKWTLSGTQCPRILHSSHLSGKFRFELLSVRVTGTRWSELKRLPCSFSLTRRPPLLQLLIFKGSSPSPPTGLPALKISSSGPNSCRELQAACAAGPKHSSSLQGHQVLLVFQISQHQQLWCKACQLTSQYEEHQAS